MRLKYSNTRVAMNSKIKHPAMKDVSGLSDSKGAKE